MMATGRVKVSFCQGCVHGEASQVPVDSPIPTHRGSISELGVYKNEAHKIGRET